MGPENILATDKIWGAGMTLTLSFHTSLIKEYLGNK